MCTIRSWRPKNADRKGGDPNQEPSSQPTLEQTRLQYMKAEIQRVEDYRAKGAPIAFALK